MATTLDDMPAGEDPVHLLLISDSKAGKSTYAAQAAKDGFRVIYVDADNGRSALRYVLKDDAEARKRVFLLPTERPAVFLSNFLRSTLAKPFLWRPDQNMLYSPLTPNLPDDTRVWKFAASEVPKEWLFVGDSWTAVSSDALGIGSADQSAVLLEGTNQGIYGEANATLTHICNLLQKVPYHTLIQAHGTKYEVYDKPLNKPPGAAIKQSEMTLREIKEVPVSCSRPHGETMVSRFNHIAWLYINGLGETDIDFTRRLGRVGGGPPNKKASTKDLPFKMLTHGVPPLVDCDTWWVETTHGEYKAAKK